MNIRDVCQEQIKYKQSNGWQIIEKSKEKVVLKMNRRAQTMTYQHDPEFGNMIRGIKEIKLEKCYVRKSHIMNYKKDAYIAIILHKNKKWRIEVEIWDDHSVYEFFSTEEFELNKPNYLALEESEKKMLKEVQLKTREFIQKDKKRRLRAIFHPFIFDDDYDWLLNA